MTTNEPEKLTAQWDYTDPTYFVLSAIRDEDFDRLYFDMKNEGLLLDDCIEQSIPEPGQYMAKFLHTYRQHNFNDQPLLKEPCSLDDMLSIYFEAGEDQVTQTGKRKYPFQFWASERDLPGPPSWRWLRNRIAECEARKRAQDLRKEILG